MTLTLKQLLPSDLSNETAFQLVQFTRRLAFALESIYFDNLLLHTRKCEHDPFPETAKDENRDPF